MSKLISRKECLYLLIDPGTRSWFASNPRSSRTASDTDGAEIARSGSGSSGSDVAGPDLSRCTSDRSSWSRVIIPARARFHSHGDVSTRDSDATRRVSQQILCI